MAISGAKRKRVSKKSKLSWRKHTKVADVEKFLDKQREDERLGTTYLETISNDHLFVLDKTREDAQIYSRQNRKVRASRPLKGFSALQPNTKVPDPIKKRNRTQTPDERKSTLVKNKESENRQNGILKAKEINAIAERRLYEIKRDKKEKRGEFSKDIWTVENQYTIEKDPWVEPVTKIHNLRNTGIPVKNILKDIQQKKSPLPAVEVPHPGMSYNPSFKDHQNLLKTVAEEEVKIIKKDEHLTRVTKGMFRKVSEGQKQTEWIVEMSEGIPSKTNEETAESKLSEDENGLDCVSINPPVKNKKKTLQQRRKQREQLKLESQRKAKKQEKKKIGDIHTIKVLHKSLEQTAKKQEKLRQIRKIKAERKKLKPKILSSTKFEDPGPDFQMGQDISGNLRNLKKEGNLLSDRFKSLQKRNILEPSKRAHKKKPKIKKYTKPGHKDDWEKTVARTSNVLKVK